MDDVRVERSICQRWPHSPTLMSRMNDDRVNGRAPPLCSSLYVYDHEHLPGTDVGTCVVAPHMCTCPPSQNSTPQETLFNFPQDPEMTTMGRDQDCSDQIQPIPPGRQLCSGLCQRFYRVASLNNLLDQCSL